MYPLQVHGSHIIFMAKIKFSCIAPLLSSISCVRLNSITFNFTVVVVYTGAGTISALKLANIHYKDALLDSDFIPQPTELLLFRGIDSKHWHGQLSSKEIGELAGVIEFELTVLNNRGHGNVTRVTSEYGNIFALIVYLL